jgi:hypothetical protein
MSKPEPLIICDDTNNHHVWAEPFNDGDSCACGRYYLDLGGYETIAAELRERDADVDEASDGPEPAA